MVVPCPAARPLQSCVPRGAHGFAPALLRSRWRAVLRGLLLRSAAGQGFAGALNSRYAWPLSLVAPRNTWTAHVRVQEAAA